MWKKLTVEDVKDSHGIHESDFNIGDLGVEFRRLPQIFLEKMLPKACCLAASAS